MINGIPNEVTEVMKTLDQDNYQAYIVGGCVRDILLNREPKDYDVCTDATPDTMRSLFSHIIPTGEQHGTMTVILNSLPIEVTTMRRDGIYKDNRHPEEVFFTNNLIEDLARRDFTINAMAYDMLGNLHDYFGGQDDLKNKYICAVNNPNDRFQEDALRMLRALRFACQLDFMLDAKTYHAIWYNKNLINNIAIERIREEFNKILVSNNPVMGIDWMFVTGLLNNFLPELCKCRGFHQQNKHHNKNVYDHTMSVLENTSNNLHIRLAALLHDIGKPMTFSVDKEGRGHFYEHHKIGADMSRDILQRFKYDNKTIEIVSNLVYNHMSRYPHLRKANLKKFITRVGEDNLEYLFELQIADIKGSKPPHDFNEVENLKNQVYEVLNQEEPLRVTDLDINGYDLMNLGIPQGKEIGRILKVLLEKVFEIPALNKKDILLEIVRKELT